MQRQLRRSLPPVGTYQLKYFLQFLAYFRGSRELRILSPSIRLASSRRRTDGIVMAMTTGVSVLREIRTRIDLSQAECAAALGVAVETFRTWDAGRRPAPAAIVRRAQTLEAKRPPHDGVPLQILADELHVHVRTLRAAARDGCLAATFGPRPYFGKLTATTTREAAAQFMTTWYRRIDGRGRRPLVPACRVTIPPNYASTLVGPRRRLGLSQQQLATKVGAAIRPWSTSGRAASGSPRPCSGYDSNGSTRQLTTSGPGRHA